MSIWHGYIAVEDENLTSAQRAAVLAAFDALGPGNDDSPARMLQRSVSLDGSKAIYEAAFDEANLTVGNVKWFLANAVGVDPDNIDHAVQTIARGTLVTYSAGGINRLRFLVFGGLSATWRASLAQVDIYIANNQDDWCPLINWSA